MLHRSPTPRPAALVAATRAVIAATAILALAGCTSDTSARSDSGKPSVVAPGKPGEPAKKLSAEEARKSVEDDGPNSADVSYVQRMIKHHGQALVMTALVPEQASSTKVKRIAARIAAAQGPEIKAMRAWLKKEAGDRKSGSHDGHGTYGDQGGSDDHGSEKESENESGHGTDHGSMPGMASEKQLDALRDAEGEDFDRLFLKLMITHHQGAVTMATEVSMEGRNTLVGEMANDVIAQQTSEIHRMRGML